MNGRVVSSEQTVLTCTKLITPQAMTQVIQFLYKGSVDLRLCSAWDLKQAAEFLDLPDLYHFIVNRIKSPKSTSQVEAAILKPVRGLLSSRDTDRMSHFLIFRSNFEGWERRV